MNIKERKGFNIAFLGMKILKEKKKGPKQCEHGINKRHFFCIKDLKERDNASLPKKTFLLSINDLNMDGHTIIVIKSQKTAP